MTVAVIAVAGFSDLAAGIVNIGQKAPELVVQELDGHSFDLGKLRGKVVVVNVWASWCPPCRAEMPALDAFYRRYRDRGLEMIGVSADRPHDRDAVVKIIHSVSYPGAMLSEAKVNGFGMPEVIPVTYIVDTQGLVRAKLGLKGGAVTEQQLADAILPMLPAEHPKVTSP